MDNRVLNPPRDSNMVYEADQMSVEEGLSHGPSGKGPKTSAISTQLNIMNTVMGVAVLSLPSVFFTTGILLGAVT